MAEGNRTTRGRVLIVDDDTALSEMLSIVLRNEGYEHVTCAPPATRRWRRSATPSRTWCCST